MRTLMIVLSFILACAACSDSDRGSDGDGRPRPSASPQTFDSTGIDWPDSGDKLVLRHRPATPDGFDDEQLDDMATILTSWASAAVLDPVRRSDDPVDDVVDALPKRTGETLRKQVAGSVSPRLAVANVFAADVDVVGRPKITTAWKVTTDNDDDGKPFVLLELQTRTAYEVRLDDGPTRVIGVLRVHGLSAFADTTDDYGVSAGWQEFGAGDCALALDDALVPDSNTEEAVEDLKTFVGVGNQDGLVMPDLDVEQQVDAEYLKRCRDGSI
ncbi:MAG: hypothetical protein JWP31_1314 [Aeromicrobium sp.]|nr:hypothetical protein [Aeromicrobium sp.]